MFRHFLIYLLYLISPKHENAYVRDHMIDTKYIPQYIYWIDGDNVLFSSYGYTTIYNTESRKSNIIPTCNSCIYGYKKGYVMCKYEHRQIHSMEEFSTTVYVYDANEILLYSKDIFPTVTPIYCSKDYVLTKSAYSFLEQKTYIYDIKKNVSKEVVLQKNREVLNGIKEEYITVSKGKDLERLILLDMDYNLWVYKKE